MASSSSSDARGLLGAALSARNPDDESKALSELYAVFKSQSGNIPILLPSLIGLLSRAGPSLKRWIGDVIDLTFCRPLLSPHAKHSSLQDRPRRRDSRHQVLPAHHPSADARRQRSGAPQTKGDVSLALVPAGHPFIHVAQLEQEGNRLLKQIVKLVFTSSAPDLVVATLNAMASLAKLRPQLSNIVLEALASWTPAALSSLSHTQIRNVEKTALLVQKKRVEDAVKEHLSRKEADANRKRKSVVEELDFAKRTKTEAAEPAAAARISSQAVGDAEAFRRASVRSNGDASTNPLAAFASS
ncbi:hypothetical protein ACQY0O_005972 [Thecaphora frezii]